MKDREFALPAAATQESGRGLTREGSTSKAVAREALREDLRSRRDAVDLHRLRRQVASYDADRIKTMTGN